MFHIVNSHYNEQHGWHMKYDYVCENCNRFFMDSDDILITFCWHEECCKVNAQCLPWHILNDPERTAKFKAFPLAMERGQIVVDF